MQMFLLIVIFLQFAACPEGASVPSLGLSNKAVYEGDNQPDKEEKHIKDQYPENYFVSTNLNGKQFTKIHRAR